MAASLTMCATLLVLWFLNPYASLVLIPAAHLWLLATLMFIDLFLLFFLSMTAVFLLRVFFADRRGGRGRQTGVARQPPRVISTDGAPAEEPEAGDD